MVEPKKQIQEKSAKLFGKASHHRPIVSENEVGELLALLLVLLQGTEYGIEGAEHYPRTGVMAIPHTAVKNLLLTQLWFCQYEPHLHWRPQLTLLYSIKNASLTQLTFWVKVLQQRCCLDNSLPCAFYTWTEITSEICSPWAGFSKRCLTWHLLSQNYLCFAQTGGQSASFMS